jgi:hypothetical protein
MTPTVFMYRVRVDHWRNGSSLVIPEIALTGIGSASTQAHACSSPWAAPSTSSSDKARFGLGSRRPGWSQLHHASASVSCNKLSSAAAPSSSISPSASSSAASTLSSRSLAPALSSVSRSGRSRRLPSAKTLTKRCVVTQAIGAPGSGARGPGAMTPRLFSGPRI